MRKPDWIRSKLPAGESYNAIKNKLRDKGLFTVCEEANCPNLAECWKNKTATLMILGDTCTRACKFCNVKTGNPKGILDPNEVEGTVEIVKQMELDYVVLTSVDRDDLSDLGAGRFSDVVKGIKKSFPTTKVEVLIPDFQGRPELLNLIIDSNPFVIAQNIETVRRLAPSVRDRRATHDTTLKVLEYVSATSSIPTKSSIMLGLGESKDEVIETLNELRNVGVKVVTLGQYLRPSVRNLPVEKYYHPDEFSELKEIALSMGFEFVASGPMVRSSYRARDYFEYLKNR